ncbi:MAG: TIM44-like domain-containing protein [Myxococcales bacterium]|nr:TIM44-like domain-containing protein [Myxococcales bacterium]
MIARRAAVAGVLLVLSPATAWAQADAPAPPPRDFVPILLFWIGAVVVMALVGRVVFREHLNERRTIRRLVHELGPFFPEFDTDALHTWVHRCAPHVFRGWRVRDLSSLADFATADFFAAQTAAFEAAARAGQQHDARLEKVLKIHPLGLHMIGDGPPPADVELVLRLELKAVDCVRDPDGAVVEGSAAVRQVQQIWTLRHDGRRWRLHHIEAAHDDVTDLASRPQAPPVAYWKRPADEPPPQETPS